MALDYIVLGGSVLRPSFPLTRKRIDIATTKRSRRGTLRSFWRAEKSEWTITWDAGEASDLAAVAALFAVKTFKSFTDEKGQTFTVLIDGEEGLTEALEFFEHNTTNAFYTFSITLIQQ
jgi:hypothetical protein